LVLEDIKQASGETELAWGSVFGGDHRAREKRNRSNRTVKGETMGKRSKGRPDCLGIF